MQGRKLPEGGAVIGRELTAVDKARAHLRGVSRVQSKLRLLHHARREGLALIHERIQRGAYPGKQRAVGGVLLKSVHKGPYGGLVFHGTGVGGELFQTVQRRALGKILACGHMELKAVVKRGNMLKEVVEIDRHGRLLACPAGACSSPRKGRKMPCAGVWVVCWNVPDILALFWGMGK